ncbi:MAG: polysulfide reductase NrfD [Desulfobacteraceae bacterium]|jgi:formate-dependent nitrite reductase membrane component NrfD
MNEVIQHIHWINHGMALGYLIACYLFFFALAEGTHVVAHLSWLYYRQDNYRPLEKVGSFLPFVILCFVSIFLIADLGHPERTLTMIYHWNWTAPVAYGFYVVLLCIISYAFHSYYLFLPEMTVKARSGAAFSGLYRLFTGHPAEGSPGQVRERHRSKERFWANASVTMSIIGLIYLGFMLSSFKGRVAWNSAVLIFIFISQGLSTGAAFLILFSQVKNALGRPSPSAAEDQEHYIAGLSRFLKYAILVHAVVWAIYLLQLQFVGQGGHAVIKLLFSGPRSGQFWLLQVAVGLALPFALVFFGSTRSQPALRALASLAVMAGAFFSTVNLFIGGQMLPMTSHQWEQVPAEPGKITFAAVVTAVVLVIFLISYKMLPYENIQSEEA